MNNGAFGENFPYSNFHDLNMDWVIKIAKDFLDQYTHIQEVIANGEQSLRDLTADGLTQLQEKADALEALLQAWYDEHSEDIAHQLADAIAALGAELANAQNNFDIHADQKAADTLASIPADYTNLSNNVNVMNNSLQGFATTYANTDLWEKGGVASDGSDDNYRIQARARTKTFIKFDRGLTITSLDGSNAQMDIKIKNNDGTITTLPWAQTRTIAPGTEARIMVDDQFNSSTTTDHTVETILSKFRILSVIAPLGEMQQSYPVTLTDGQLDVMSIDHIANLPKNRFYNLVSTTINGLPEDISTPINGILACFTSQINGWNMYILTTNTGMTRFGTSVGTTMRWDSGNTLERYQYLITDGRLETMEKSNIRDLPKNKIYSLMNVSALNDLPAQAENPFTGFLICFGTATNGWPGYLLINNNGTTYTGTSTGTQTRWEYAHNSLTKQISGIINKKVVLVGDSIMYGSHMSDAGEGSRTVITIRGTTVKENTSNIVWSKGFKDYLVNTYDCTVLNQSFPGCSFNDVSNNLSTLIPSDYDYAIIMLGVNDWGSPASVATHILTISLYCKTNNIIPIFITPYPAREYVKQLAQIRLNIMTYNNEVADFYTKFTEFIDFKNINLASIMDDTIHYNDTAQPYILECVKRCLGL